MDALEHRLAGIQRTGSGADHGPTPFLPIHKTPRGGHPDSPRRGTGTGFLTPQSESLPVAGDDARRMTGTISPSATVPSRTLLASATSICGQVTIPETASGGLRSVEIGWHWRRVGEKSVWLNHTDFSLKAVYVRSPNNQRR